MNVRAVAAEAIGTFILVFFGSLGFATVFVITSGQGSPIVALIAVPFAFGLGLMAAIAVGGPTSGGHFNPAVTLAALFDGRVTWIDAIGYMIAQVGGAVIASLAIKLATASDVVTTTVSQPGPVPGATDALTLEIHAFAIEVILTAVFVAVILTVTRKAPSAAIIVIPLTLVAIHFAAMHISGASVNPARSLAPAVVSGTYTSLWVYLTAPFLGSAIGWGVYRLLLAEDDDETADDDEVEDEDLDEFDDLEDVLEAKA
jgi:aquaporin Z